MPKTPDRPENGPSRRVGKIILPKLQDLPVRPSSRRQPDKADRRQHQRRGGKPPRFPGRTGGR